MSSLSHHPVLKGKKYCAPFCGRGCTKAEYDAAVKLGEKTLKMLKDPKGWEIDVWENLGWHVCLRKGGFSLHTHIYDGVVQYSSLLSSHGSGGGDPAWTETFHHEDPNVVIERQLELCRNHLKEMAVHLRPFIKLEVK